MKRVDKTNLAIFTTIVVFAVFALWALFWLKERFEREREDKIKTIESHFSPDVLGMPDDLETLSFAELESLKRTLLPDTESGRDPYVRDIVVSKTIAGRGERFVLPYQYKLLYPDWQERLRGLERHPRTAREGDRVIEYGAVYFDFDNTRIHRVYAAIGALAVLLILVLALLGRRIRVQEVTLTQTTVELEEKKRELVEMERLSLAGQISANVFHDIRKPILNIRMDVEEAQSPGGDSKPPAERFAEIRGQVDLFFNILRDLNIERFIRGDQTDSEFVNVNELLDRACALVRYEQGGVETRTDYVDSPPPILSFPYRLIQVFSNIILNAYQAMAGKGRLDISTRHDGDRLVIRIADSGPGIEPDHLQRIFEPFFSTQQESGGSGLGLYISKGIIEDLGGTIEVTSAPGGGTTFEICLPVSSRKTAPSPATAETTAE